MTSTPNPYSQYMKRALELAKFGEGNVSPNPMVGAVIVAPSGKIIGEGWHRKFGGPHAEVNAVNSVTAENEHLIPESTIYVTLEPCSHYGKTPPCSKLIIKKGFKRVVVGMTDPFKEVSGRGIKMIREAGIEVIVPFMERECLEINRRFVTAHTLKRPYILLKWAETADGFIAPHNGSIPLSNTLSKVTMHKERSLFDAIMVGTDTILIDNPSLTNRMWAGDSPRPVIFDSKRIPKGAAVMDRCIRIPKDKSLQDSMNRLYSEYKITSLMVEGGAKLLSSFIESDLFDELRIETSPILLQEGIRSPGIPVGAILKSTETVRDNIINRYIFKHCF